MKKNQISTTLKMVEEKVGAIGQVRMAVVPGDDFIPERLVVVYKTATGNRTVHISLETGDVVEWNA